MKKLLFYVMILSLFLFSCTLETIIIENQEIKINDEANVSNDLAFGLVKLKQWGTGQGNVKNILNFLFAKIYRCRITVKWSDGCRRFPTAYPDSAYLTVKGTLYWAICT